MSFIKREGKNIIDAALQDITDKFPDNAPYVLTHSDLNIVNIIIKIEAIIDWEVAFYYLLWVERWALRQNAGNVCSNCSTWFGRSSILTLTTIS
jgi:hypothetical protein